MIGVAKISPALEGVKVRVSISNGRKCFSLKRYSSEGQVSRSNLMPMLLLMVFVSITCASSNYNFGRSPSDFAHLKSNHFEAL